MAERDAELEQLQRDLAALDAERSDVAAELLEASALVESDGVLPALPRLERAKRAFDDLLTRLHDALGRAAETSASEPVEGLPRAGAEDEGARRFADLASACEALSSRKEAQTRRLQRAAVARALLGRFDRLRARSPDGRALLESLLERVRELVRALEGDSPAQLADEVTQGRHSLVLFLDLVEESQHSLDGDRLTQLEDQVAEALGTPFRRLAGRLDVVDESGGSDAREALGSRLLEAANGAQRDRADEGAPAPTIASPAHEQGVASAIAYAPSPPGGSSRAPDGSGAGTAVRAESAGAREQARGPSGEGALPLTEAGADGPDADVGAGAAVPDAEAGDREAGEDASTGVVDPGAVEGALADEAVELDGGDKADDPAGAMEAVPGSEPDVATGVVASDVEPRPRPPASEQATALPESGATGEGAFAQHPPQAEEPEPEGAQDGARAHPATGPFTLAGPKVVAVPTAAPSKCHFEVPEPISDFGRLSQALPKGAAHWQKLARTRLSEGRLLEAAAFAHVAHTQCGLRDVPPAPLLLAFLGERRYLPEGASAERWEEWLQELRATDTPHDELGPAVLWCLSEVLWRGWVVSRFHDVEQAVSTAFSGQSAPKTHELVRSLFEMALFGQDPGGQLLALPVAAPTQGSEDKPEDAERDLLNTIQLCHNNTSFKNADCKRAWRRIDLDWVRPLERAVKGGRPTAEVQRLLLALDPLERLRADGVVGLYLNQMGQRTEKLREAVERWIRAKDVQASPRSGGADRQQRLRELLVEAPKEGPWQALLARALKPAPTRAAHGGRMSSEQIRLPKGLLDALEGLEAWTSVFPVSCDPEVQEVDLAELAAALLVEPIDPKDAEACVEGYFARGEFEAGQVLLKKRAGELEAPRREELASRAGDELFSRQGAAEAAIQECRELWSEGRSAEIVDPRTHGQPVEVAQAWLDRRAARLGPLEDYLDRLRAELRRTLDAHAELLRWQIAEQRRRLELVAQGPEAQREVGEFTTRLERGVGDREWALVQNGLAQLEGVTGDTTALRLAGDLQHEETWRRAVDYRQVSVQKRDLADVIVAAQGEAEGRKFLDSWRNQRTSKTSATRLHLGLQLGRWLGLEDKDGRPHGEDGVILEATLRSTVPWVAPAYGERESRVFLLVPNARRDQTPQALRRMAKFLCEQAQGRGLRVFLYPGVAPAEMRRAQDLAKDPAILDDEDLFRLARCPVDERARGFLEVVLPQFPIETVSAYQVQHGATPESMFVGRTQELERLLQRHECPTIVFSGRCLGKTSLLRQVQRRFHAPETLHHAFFHSVSTLGELDVTEDGDDVPNLELLELIAGDLRSLDPEFSAEPMDTGRFKAAVRLLLKHSPTAEYLFLFDEADALADSERRLGRRKGVTWALRDLQAESEDRLRFVFAGYQHVHRVYRQQSLAFANWRGLCELSVLEQPDAEKLVRCPMEELGFQFGSPRLVERIVHYCGRHPRLIQVFCDRLARNVRARRRSEPGTITHADVEQVFNDVGTSGFVESLRQTLDLNLQEDPRLQFMVYWLVEQAMRGALSLGHFRLQTVRQALIDSGNEPSLLDDTETLLLLKELQALGVVEKQADGYRLANRQHARLLFQAADFDHKRTSAVDRLRQRPRPRRVVVLDDRQADTLIGALDQHVCLIGSELAEAAVAIESLFDAESERVLQVDCESASSWEEVEVRLRRAAGLAEEERVDLGEALCEPAKGQRTVILQSVDECVAKDLSRVAAFLEDLSNRRLDGADGLAVRVILTGRVALARAYRDELQLYGSTAARLSRLASPDLSRWRRTRRIVCEGELDRRLRALTGGRFMLLEEFAGRRKVAPDEEWVVEAKDLAAFEEALGSPTGKAFGRKLVAGLTEVERAVLRFAVAFEDGSAGAEVLSEDREYFVLMLHEQHPETSQLDELGVADVVDLLVSVDLLAAPRDAKGWFMRDRDDPLMRLLDG